MTALEMLKLAIRIIERNESMEELRNKQVPMGGSVVVTKWELPFFELPCVEVRCVDIKES